jgi:hypothetical protein
MVIEIKKRFLSGKLIHCFSPYLLSKSSTIMDFLDLQIKTYAISIRRNSDLAFSECFLDFDSSFWEEFSHLVRKKKPLQSAFNRPLTVFSDLFASDSI